MPVETPAAIRTFIDATNAEDDDLFVATFADDAVIDDFGRIFTGTEGVTSWNGTDNIGKHSRLDLIEIVEGGAEGEYVVTIEVSGEGYNGLGTLTFVVERDLVTSLVIT